MSDFQPFTVVKPWGDFRQFTEGAEPVVVKIIGLKKGESLSLQYHTKRSEFWRILSGTVEATIGDNTIRVEKGEEVSIPIGVHHRASAPDGDAEILETARGEFDEADIVRMKDNYGRI